MRAAHVVADPLADNDPWLTPAIDWERTLAFRHRLWDLGLGVAEAMDTAQRGMGLGWPEAQELIRRALAEAKGRPDALIACGAGTDHLAPGAGRDDRRRARAPTRSRSSMVEAAGGRIILMASRALAAAAKGPDDYLRVYDRILSQVKQPVIIHWLGEMFDPALEGYWGHADHMAAMDTCLAAIEANAAKVDGIKVSLLSKEKEIAMRRRLPEGVRMYTGDDFNYAELIAGDEDGPFRRAARHLRRHRAGRLRRAGGARARQRQRVLRPARADRAAVAAHLQGADPLLQDRRGVPRLPQRPAGPFRDDRRPAERPLAASTSPSSSASPTRRACSPTRSRRRCA